jgi:hypothetical protein
LSLIPCSFFKDQAPSWQYQTISLGTLFINDFMMIVKGKVCFLTNFRDSYFQGAVLHEQTAIIAACSIMSRAKKHPIFINLRFAVLAHSNTLTLLSHL